MGSQRPSQAQIIGRYQSVQRTDWLVGEMLATGAAAITAIGGYGAYLGLSRSKDTNAPTPIDDEPEVVGRTWKESAGRTSGRDGHVFVTSRGVIVRVFGQNEESADAAAEAQGDAQHSQVQRLVKEAGAVQGPRLHRLD